MGGESNGGDGVTGTGTEEGDREAVRKGMREVDDGDFGEELAKAASRSFSLYISINDAVLLAFAFGGGGGEASSGDMSMCCRLS